MTTIPALTVRQPYASLIAAGLKRYEFRDWLAPAALWRSRIAIHAGLRMADIDEIAVLHKRLGHPQWRWMAGCPDHEAARAWLACVLPPRLPVWLRDLPRGQIVATARLAACVSARRLAGDAEHPAPWERRHHRWGWDLQDVRPATSAPIRGRLGIWYAPADAVIEADAA